MPHCMRILPCMQAVGTFEGLMEEITQYKESDALLGDEAVAQGDFAIAQGLKFTNKAANGIHSMSCKVGTVSLAACTLAVMHLCFCWRVSEVQARKKMVVDWQHTVGHCPSRKRCSRAHRAECSAPATVMHLSHLAPHTSSTICI